MNDYADLDAAALGRALAQGLSAVELTETLLADIAARDPRLRAFITVTAEPALTAAAASDRRRAAGQTLGPLDGIPVALKDNIDVAGTSGTAGLALWRERQPERDAGVTARLKTAGAVILGKLNMHEAALGATSDNPSYGRCDNPRRPGYTPGGSSGGSAAAVAAGFCPLTLGTDTLGSVRIPAAYCGVYGIKPTAGLVGRSGVVPLSWTLDHVGPLGRSLNDLALALNVLAGVDRDDFASVAPPPGWRADFTPRYELRGITLGRPVQLEQLELEPAVCDAYERGTDLARKLGAVVRQVSIDGWQPGKTRRAGLLAVEVEAAVIFAAGLQHDPDGFSAEFRRLIDYGCRQPAERLAAGYRLLQQTGHGCRTVLAEQRLDALLLPTAPQRAFAHNVPAPADQADLTALANAAGLPALSLPIAADDGLPGALQLIGPAFGEHRLLSIGSAFSTPGSRPGRDLHGP